MSIYLTMYLVIALLFLTLILLFLCAFGLYCKSTNQLCKSKKRLDGKTCIVTGGTSGMGLEIAVDFAMRGARVIIAGPFLDEGEAARQTIIEQSGSQNVTFKYVDYTSFDTVRAFAADIIKSENRLDILMNNAGVSGLEKRTKDGLHIITQVNYLAHFLLTILLLPLLKKTGTPSEPTRIVNTNSVMHWYTPWFKVSELTKCEINENNLFKKLVIYGKSKLCMLMFSRELTRRLSGSNVVIADADPGAIATRIYLTGGYGIVGYFLYYLYFFFSKSPFEGSQTIIHVALEEAGKVSGKFFKDCAVRSASSIADDSTMVSSLWEETVACIKLTNEELNEALS